MREKLKNILLRKNQGDSAYVNMAVVIILFSVFFVVMTLSYLVWMQEVNTMDNIYLILTTHCKRMESQGCLTLNDKAALEEDLKKAGFYITNIEGLGTDGTIQPYGENIEIIISGNIDIAAVGDGKETVSNIVNGLRKYLGNQDLFKFENRTIKKSSISKMIE